MLNINDSAPDFELPDQRGNLLTLDGLLTRGPLLLYFYPADFSPVCTAEACAFRDSFAGVESVKTQIVGVSPQNEATHARFADQYAIPFPLLADSRKQLIRAFGVDGPLGFGVRRATYLIDQQKVIRNRVVSDFFVGSHLALIKETLKAQTSA